jgi:hypothetical protein
MSKIGGHRVLATMHIDDYHPDALSELVFKRENGGWFDLAELNERLCDRVAKIVALMEHGDSLTITLDAKSQEADDAEG